MNKHTGFMLPVLLENHHVKDQFSCEYEALNIYLNKYAYQNNKNNSSRAYVSLCKISRVIAGYYTLSYGSISHTEAKEKVKKRMPKYPIPVMILARLAVDKKYRSLGLGSSLLRNAIQRAVQAANIAGLKAIIAHAKDQKAKNFYLKYGFEESVLDEYHLMITIQDIQFIIEKIEKNKCQITSI